MRGPAADCDGRRARAPVPPPITHAVGFSGVEASDAGVNCGMHGALKLYSVYIAVGAANLPTAEADCRNLQAGSSELLEFHPVQR
jgi:hypothetical protein